jgi:arylsulfatase A-like enzyme
MVFPRGSFVAAALIAAAVVSSCSGGASPDSGATPIRLVDLFKPEAVTGTAAARPDIPRTEWRFDGAAPTPAPAEFPATRGVEANANVQTFGIRDGRLVGRSTTDMPLIRVARTRDLESRDQFHSIEISLRASAGANLTVSVRGPGPINLKEEDSRMRGPLGTFSSPIVAGPETKTYTLTSPVSTPLSRARHILIRPTDAAGATFEIESIRLITRAEHLASVSSGVGWQGLSEIFRESLVTRSPETMKFDVTLPTRAWLDLAVGTVDDRPATFRVAVTPAASSSGETVLMDYTVTTPYRWERQPIDLSAFGGRHVQLAFSVVAEAEGTPGIWGTPVIRAKPAIGEGAPQGVIVIQADTLRPDHLGFYGHKRDTAPYLNRFASEGTVFQHAYAQAGWTKVSTPSIMTSLYPSTHGVAKIADRLPAAATTMAEVYRGAGYATFGVSSVMFTGQFTNLHQGFEELHELTSVADSGGPYSSKTSREYVDRTADWIDRHKDEPFFIYLHVFDPHSPYEPRRPYDTIWADPSKREEHLRQREALRKTIVSPFHRGRGMATRDEMIKAGVEPAAYIAYDKDWYDSSIRGMDVEIARLMERLRVAGLDDKTAVVFLSDHGEEFHEHGRMWHGQSAYGEMVRVPLVVRWPGHVAARRVDHPVQLIDVMPTLLDLSRLTHPEGLQGQSLLPLLAQPGAGGAGTVSAADAGWRRRPAIIEKRPEGAPEFPAALESTAIVDGQWKLIHNTVRPPDRPEFELFDAVRDPLDQANVADKHPDVVKRLAKTLEGFKAMAAAARLKPDSETTGNMTPEQLQRLRSLGYIK